MTKDNKMRFRRIYNIILSIVIAIAGICFIAGVLSIYNSGDHPFSREVVAATFSGIAFPVYLCIAMIIISFVLEVFLPSNLETKTNQKDYAGLTVLLYRKKDFNQGDESVRNEILSLQKNRKLHVVIRTVIFLITGIIFLLYALNGENYHQSEINDSMIKAMQVLIPCFLVAFAYALFVSIHNEKSWQKELELVKQLPANDKNDNTSYIEETASEKKLNLSRIVIVAVSIIFIVYGIITGGTVDVLTKAINICTECIGLG